MNDKLITYMAICLGISMCVYRVSTAIGNVFSILTILLFLYLLYQYKRNAISVLGCVTKEIKCAQKVLFILIISMLPNILFSYDIKDSVKCFFDMWVYRVIAFWIVTLFIKDKGVLIKMLLVFLAAECVESVYVTYKVMGGAFRHPGFGHNVMHLSAILAIMFPILCVLIADKKFNNKERIISLILGSCMLAGIIATQTRGLWLSLIIVCPLVLYRYVLKSKKHMIVALLILTSIAGFFVTSPQFSNRFKSIANVTTDRSNISRIMIWESSINMIKDHPVTGVGLDCFKRVYDKEYKRDVEKEMKFNLAHTHNNFLQIFTEAGIFGFLGFFSFTIFMLWSNFKAWVKTRNPYALMLFGVWSAFTLFGMIDNTIDGSAASKALWYLTGLLVALKSSNAKENS